MQPRQLSFTRSIMVIVTCLLVLSQASCASLQIASLKPGSGGGDSGEDPQGGTGKSSTGATVGIATLVVVGGYLIYRAVTGGPDEESETTETEAGFTTPNVVQQGPGNHWSVMPQAIFDLSFSGLQGTWSWEVSGGGPDPHRTDSTFTRERGGGHSGG